MPRDDLSIDFVKKMPSAEPQDPGLILDDWINRTANLPDEIRFMQEEIAEKDRTYHECVKTIEEHDVRIQKWIKTNGSHSNNPREEGYRKIITENYRRADKLATEKILLTQKMQAVMDKHLRYLDAQIKVLYDRTEPGFTDPDELPSILRPSAANNSNTSLRVLAASTNTTPLNPILNNSTPTAARLGNPQVRNTQAQQQNHNSVSAPATPAASMILQRNVRESSAGPGSGVPSKRGPRVNSGLGSAPQPSSGLARHSSLGPGTPKGSGTANTVRAGSAGPRASTKTNGSVRKGTPVSSRGLKKPPPGTKSTLSRVKRAGTSKGSPASTADSELSDAESGSDAGSGSENGSHASKRGTPAPRHSHGPPGRQKHKDADGDESMGGADDDDEDGEGDSDDKKYCLCQNVSYGDMVACDNDDCPYEWFHWSCVGLKSEPEGRWFCPACTENMKKKGK